MTGAGLTLILVPHGQHSEDEGTEGGGKEASPVVPHGKKGGRHFDAEEHTCHTPGTHSLMLLHLPNISVCCIHILDDIYCPTLSL